jgi:putative membrane protein
MGLRIAGDIAMNLSAMLAAAVFVLTPAGALLAQGTGTAPTDSAAQTAPVTQPQDFADKAASANMFEIESSKLALQAVEDADVKAFAQKMIEDHSAAGEKIKQAATDENVTVPTEMGQMEQAMLTDLKSMTGAEFQKAYVDDQVKGHDQAVALFQGYADGGPDGALKDFAAATLPTLQEHQSMIHKLAGQ